MQRAYGKKARLAKQTSLAFAARAWLDASRPPFSGFRPPAFRSPWSGQVEGWSGVDSEAELRCAAHPPYLLSCGKYEPWPCHSGGRFEIGPSAHELNFELAFKRLRGWEDQWNAEEGAVRGTCCSMCFLCPGISVARPCAGTGHVRTALPHGSTGRRQEQGSSAQLGER